MNIVTATAERVAAGQARQIAPWQASLRQAIRDPAELLERLGLSGASEVFDSEAGDSEAADAGTAELGGAELGSAAVEASLSFPTFVPLEYLSRIQPGNLNDPLLRQVLPVREELETPAGFSVDPLQESAATQADGLLQKYAGRVLLVTTGACAVHCRYCFRRHFPYEDVPGAIERWQPALEQIAADKSIREVLLSGGDPLMLSDERLRALIERLEGIEHLKRLRIHTRLPVMIPSRVTDNLVDRLRSSRLTSLVVVHVNHAAEIDTEVAAAMAKLVDAGIQVLNQAVLLRGVNDEVEALADLSERLLEVRVMPYYLHQLDRVAGAAHFEVPVEQGRELVSQLRARLPGYAVPRYVAELPGELNKTVLA